MSFGKIAMRSFLEYRRGRDWFFSKLMAGAFAHFDCHSVIQLPTRINGAENISIGSGVCVGPNSWLLAKHGPSRIVIGDGTQMSGHCTISAAHSVILGRDVLIARYVLITDHGHQFEDMTLPVLRQGLRDIKPVVIGDGAWLGQSVYIGPGVTIGRGAVVGANSVVLDDVPDHSVAVGAPARIVRSLQTPDRLIQPASPNYIGPREEAPEKTE